MPEIPANPQNRALTTALVENVIELHELSYFTNVGWTCDCGVQFFDETQEEVHDSHRRHVAEQVVLATYSIAERQHTSYLLSQGKLRISERKVIPLEKWHVRVVG